MIAPAIRWARMNRDGERCRFRCVHVFDGLRGTAVLPAAEGSLSGNRRYLPSKVRFVVDEGNVEESLYVGRLAAPESFDVFRH
jgi:hypothetical protein